MAKYEIEWRETVQSATTYTYRQTVEADSADEAKEIRDAAEAELIDEDEFKNYVSEDEVDYVTCLTPGHEEPGKWDCSINESELQMITPLLDERVGCCLVGKPQRPTKRILFIPPAGIQAGHYERAVAKEIHRTMLTGCVRDFPKWLNERKQLDDLMQQLLDQYALEMSA